MEAEYLAAVKKSTGVVSVPPQLWTIQMEVRPYAPNWATVWLPDLDPMAKSWPVEDEGAYGWAYGPPA